MLERRISASEKPWDMIAEFANIVFPALVIVSEEDDVESSELLDQHPFLSKETFPAYYEALMGQLRESLVRCVKDAPQDEILNLLLVHAEAFSTLMDIGQRYRRKNILNVAMKHCRAFVDSFARVALPVMDVLFADHKQLINCILKSVQIGTRVIQNVCHHSKAEKDARLTSSVPLVRKTLENFIYAVKALLKKHNALSAFWVGNLKHRDLDGQIVSSQYNHDKEDDKEEEDAPSPRVRKRKLKEGKGVKRAKKAGRAMPSSQSSSSFETHASKLIELGTDGDTTDEEASAGKSDRKLSSSYVADSDQESDDDQISDMYRKRYQYMEPMAEESEEDDE